MTRPCLLCFFWMLFSPTLALNLKEQIMEATLDEKLLQKIHYGLIIAVAIIGIILICASIFTHL